MNVQKLDTQLFVITARFEGRRVFANNSTWPAEEFSSVFNEDCVLKSKEVPSLYRKAQGKGYAEIEVRPVVIGGPLSVRELDALLHVQT